MSIYCEEQFCYLENKFVPKRYKKVELDGKSKCSQQLKKFKLGNIIVLAGSYGCGKTHSICAYLQTLKNSDWCYMNANELYNAVKRDSTLIKNLRELEILAIDDLGVEYEAHSGFFASVLDEILDYRYNEGLTTLIGTNLSLKDFRTRYGGRLIDRIKEWGTFYETNEKSFRKREAK